MFSNVSHVNKTKQMDIIPRCKQFYTDTHTYSHFIRVISILFQDLTGSITLIEKKNVQLRSASGFDDIGCNYKLKCVTIKGRCISVWA